MGIVSFCPNGHRVKVKDHLAGRKGICPRCGSRFRIPSPVPQAIAPSRPVAAPLMPSARIVSFDAVLAASLPPALALSAEPALMEPAAMPACQAVAEPVPAEPPAEECPPAEQQAVARTEPAVAPDAPAVAPDEPDWLVPELGDVPAADIELLADHGPSMYAAIDAQPELPWYVSSNGSGRWQSADAMRRWLDSGEASGEELVWRADWKDGRRIYEAFPEIKPGAGW